VFHKQYKYLEQEYKNYTLSGKPSFYTYLLQYVEDEELHSCINFMNFLREKDINIFDLKKKAEQAVSNPNVWVVTAHSFKGREVDTVVIEESMNKSVEKVLARKKEEGCVLTPSEMEELHLGYVAATRAKHKLLECRYL
jgi:superfamily I DNA/RNA helicase